MKYFLPGIVLTLMVPIQVYSEGSRWHPLEKYCVTREATGMSSGTIEECSCDWGRKRYEIQNTEMKLGSVKIPTRQHMIQVGSELTTFDPQTGRGTVTQVPEYEAFPESEEGIDAMEKMRIMAESMGGSVTDRKKKIADTECRVVENPVIGDMCISEDGIVLELIAMDGMMTQVATEFDTDTCGDMQNYELPADVVISDVPEMGSILEQLEQMHENLPSE